MQLWASGVLGRYILSRATKSEFIGVMQPIYIGILTVILYQILSYTLSPRTISSFLEWAFEVTKASLQRAEDEVFDKDSGRKYILMIPPLETSCFCSQHHRLPPFF